MEKILKTLGLKDDEVKAFIFLLENGEMTAGNLAKKTGLSRPSLYGFLKKMQHTGLVVESQKNGIKTFFAGNEEKIDSILKEQISELENSRDRVKDAFSSLRTEGASVNPKFQLFEGKQGLQQVLKDMLLYRNIETKAYWPIKAMVDILGQDFFRYHNKERVKQNIYTQAIWPEKQKVNIKSHPYLGVGEKFLREIRIAPKSISFSMGYWIYGNKVAFISSQKESFGFIIESKELVDMLTSQFEIIWDMSKKIQVNKIDTENFI